MKYQVETYHYMQVLKKVSAKSGPFQTSKNIRSKIISTNQSRHQSCLTFSNSQSANWIHGNTPL